MAADPLDPEARALWRRVAETVRPLRGRKTPSSSREREEAKPKALEDEGTLMAVATVRVPSTSHVLAHAGPSLSPKGRGVRDTLDAAWDRKLARGLVAPDLTIDLHGHTASAAHVALEAGLTHAVARHARLILLVTGKPPPPGRSRLDNPLRGVIRASIGDWLHHSRHADRIAAVRNAHPRHGGAGALYVVLRRVR